MKSKSQNLILSLLRSRSKDKKIRKYKELPDVLSKEELAVLFNELLDAYLHKNQFTELELVSALCELADRQWHTYELLDNETKQRLENVLKNIWINHGLVGDILFVVACLGLKEAYELIKKDYMLKELDPEIREIIGRFIDEVDGNIEDPYSGMK